MAALQRFLRLRSAKGLFWLALFLALDWAFVAAMWAHGEVAASDRTMAQTDNAADAAVVYFTDDANARTLRLERAAALAREGSVRSLFMAGGYRSPERESGARKMAVAAASMVSVTVSSDSGSYDTHTNVSAALEEADRAGWRRIVHVSDAMHLARIASIIAEREGVPGARHAYAKAPYDGLWHIWRRAHYEGATRLVARFGPPGATTRLAARLRLSTGDAEAGS